MKRKTFILLACILASVPLLAQNNISGYRYWFDNNSGGIITTSIAPAVNFNLNSAISGSSLTAGTHALVMQFKDQNGKWSEPVVQNFIVYPTSNITGYEYWVDNNHAARLSQAVAAVNIEILIANLSTPSFSMATGLHIFNIRFKDNNGLWSEIMSQYFMNFPSANVSSYEYWVDSNYTGKISQAVTPATTENLTANLSIPKLPAGLHHFYIRFKDNNGLWSEALSQNFNVDLTGNVIIGYRTWLDNTVGPNAYHPFALASVKDSLKGLLSQVQADSGKHVFYVQFKDKAGHWSSIVGDSFLKSTHAGIGTITPDSASDYSADTLTINGNGFTDSAKVSLTMAGQTDILPKYFKKISAHQLVVYFDFTGKKPGFWNVVVNIPKDTLMTLDSGFYVYDGIFITSTVDTTYKASQQVTINYTVAYPFNPGNVFSLQIINTLGKLKEPVLCGAVTATGGGSISGTIPANLPAGCGYEFRIFGNNPYAMSTVTAPFAVQDAISPTGDYAMQFDGINGNVDLGTWFNQDSFTVSFWMKADSVQPGSASSPSIAFDMQNDIACYANPTVQNNYILSHLLEQDVFANRWQQITYTVSRATGLRKMYLFGQLVQRRTWAYSPQAGHDMQLGYGGYNGELFSHWKGLIDEVKIFDGVLSDSAIKAGVNQKLTGTEAGLLAYWDFNDDQCGGISLDKTKSQRMAIINKGAIRVPSTVPNIGQQVIPNYGGNTNVVMVNIFGAGFQSGASVKFAKTGFPDIVSDSVLVSSDGSVALCRFNLTGTKIGLYDVVLANSDTTVFTYANSFTIETGTKPDVWFDIIGKNIIQQHFTSEAPLNTVVIAYGNNGNVAAKMVPINFVVSDTTTKVELLFTVAKPSTGNSTYDSMIAIAPDYAIIDTLFGEPFSGKMFKYYIPLIMPGVNGTLAFRITTAAGSTAPVIITAWVDSPLYQSPLNPAYVDCIHSSISAVLGPLIGVVPVAGCLVTVADKVLYPLIMSSQYGSYAQQHDEIGFSTLCDVLDIIVSCLPAVGALKFAKNSLTKPGYLKSFWNAVVRNWDLISSGEGLGTSGKSFIFDCKDGYDAYKKSKKTLTQTQVGAFDPNSKAGPSKYINATDAFNYTIGFENKPTATAPAQQVTVIDTLDISKFDLKTFSFTTIGWGNAVYVPAQTFQKSFVTDYNYVNADSIVVRVEGRLDTVSGIVRWRFSSLDPVSMQVSNNALRGFLPPNDSTHRGDGFVSYAVHLKPGITTSTNVNNAATIYFDYDLPLATKNYNNIIDNIRPHSSIISLGQTNDSFINAAWSGIDTGSGIRYYDIYFSDNSDTFSTILLHTSLTKSTFYGKIGHTYRFFSLATDSAGNRQTDTLPIKSITLSGIDPSLKTASKFKVAPNPFNTNFVLSYTLPFNANVQACIYDLPGQLIGTICNEKQTKGSHQYEIEASAYPPGVYLIKLTVNGMPITQKLVKMRY